MNNTISYNLQGSLGFRASVLQAEMHAISQAASSLSWQQNKDIYVFVNNLSTLQVFDRFENKDMHPGRVSRFP